MASPTPFSTNLRRALKETNGGMTQEQFARMLDVSNRTVQGWCLGESEPQPRLRKAIAAALDREADWFYSPHEGAPA